jgi:CO/xanthine dehydrogenase Mo-binding subunit/aerobic-type carbon monoxide dehydrogenase small subunit (CoxS/CutS family)
MNSTSATVNGRQTSLPSDGARRISDFLRLDLQLTGTKVGCNQGDCGSCAVVVDGEAILSCITPCGRTQGSDIVTVEGLAERPLGQALQRAFQARQAIQCGFCTPGFLNTAYALLERTPSPTKDEVREELAGVLCRCTGYHKVVEAVIDVISDTVNVAEREVPLDRPTVGVPIARLDGAGKAIGIDKFGADGIPAGALYLRAVRSPYNRARVALGDIAAYQSANPGIVAILTAADIPGRNLHGVAVSFADQPVFAVGEVRFKGEAVAAVVAERECVDALDLRDFPVSWEPMSELLELSEATGSDTLLHPERANNVLIEGVVARGDAIAALKTPAYVVKGKFATQFVEHAYIEPEAGWATVDGDDVVVHSCTQAPHAHRSDLALILGRAPEHVRVIPSAVGGGFGGKLDLTTQPYVALAAAKLRRPVAMVLSRAESIAISTKRHPARIESTLACDRHGKITAIRFEGDFNTGAYASWGTAVANRVPVHASGPYFVPHYHAHARAIHTHITPAGAFRGFGVPQTVFAQEQLVDDMVRLIGDHPIDFRIRNALRVGEEMVTGQCLKDSIGIVHCLEALRPNFETARNRAKQLNEGATRYRHGVGLAAMFYGCGNTAMSNPSTIRIGVRPTGEIVLHQGAVDAGQGSNTVIPQIAADALGIPVTDLVIIGPDTSITPDCGRTSASRQTFVTGKAAELASRSLRAKILRLANAGPDATIRSGDGWISIRDGDEVRRVSLADMPANKIGYALMAEETFDPPTTALGENGQGSPYAVYAFGAQLAEVSVDLDTGLVRANRFTAAHDVGRMVNPTLLEGQIEGAIAQGVGMALMERFVPGKTENLHDYVIPSLIDMPTVESIFIEEAAAIGPFGAKGIGEPSLVPTSAAIANAIFDAIDARVRTLPATPDQILDLLAQKCSSRP